jgi:hypothetical protein
VRRRHYDAFDEDQVVLPLEELVAIPRMPSASIQARFEAFHEANPWVLRSLVRLTEDWVARGRGRCSIDMLVHVLRWRHSRVTVGEQLKINNNYTSRYVRLIVDQRPDLADVFLIRELRAA